MARAARRVPAHLGVRDAVLRRSAPAARRSPRRGGWNEALYRTWYLTGAVWTAGWLGLGTAFLLGRTRFGYSFALCLFLAGLFTFLVRNKPEYAGAGTLPLLYFIAAGLLALAVAVETYFANDRWPILAAAAVVGATRPQRRPDGDDDAAGARLRGRSGDRRPDRRRSSRRSSGC